MNDQQPGFSGEPPIEDAVLPQGCKAGLYLFFSLMAAVWLSMIGRSLGLW